MGPPLAGALFGRWPWFPNQPTHLGLKDGEIIPYLKDCFLFWMPKPYATAFDAPITSTLGLVNQFIASRRWGWKQSTTYCFTITKLCTHIWSLFGLFFWDKRGDSFQERFTTSESRTPPNRPKAHMDWNSILSPSAWVPECQYIQLFICLFIDL